MPRRVNTNSSPRKNYSRVDPLVDGSEKTLKGNGGENKNGEQNNMFWAELNNRSIHRENRTRNSPTRRRTGDTQKLGESNCKNTHYVEGGGNEFPPESTLVSWSEAKAALKETITHLRPDVHPRVQEYAPYLEKFGVKEAEGEPKVTTAENYLAFVVSPSAGGKAVKRHDYEALPKEVVKKAEKGVKEIEW